MLWHRMLAVLAAFAADPAAQEQEPPRAAAAVAVAYAAQASRLKPPAPAPGPADECCGECNGTGKIRHPDGHVTDCPCPATCECKASREDEQLAEPGGTACPDGKCNVRVRR